MMTLRLIPGGRRSVRLQPVTLEGRLLKHALTGVQLRLGWAEGRCLAEAIHVALSQARPVQIGSYGWVVRRSRCRVEISGPRFPDVSLTMGQAATIGRALATMPRRVMLEVA